MLTTPLNQPRIEGKVEIRPTSGIVAPVSISLVKISLQRCETIHPAADSLTKKRLGPPRKEITELVGPEMTLFQCSPGKDYENVFSMDLPFALFIPIGKEGQSATRKAPPASLQLPNRTAETYYEMVVIVVQQNHADQNKYAFPVPISRYDTLSTFGMFNQPKSAEEMTDHLVILGLTLPRLSYGPLDPINASITLSPNPNWPRKSKRVAIKSISIAIEEEIIYNHEGDEPQRKVKTIEKSTQNLGVKLPDDGYFTNMALIFPSKEIRDSDGIIPRGKQGFPVYSVSAFTTTGSLYKIEYFIAVKVSFNFTPISPYVHLVTELGSYRRIFHPRKISQFVSRLLYALLTISDAQMKWMVSNKQRRVRQK